MGNEGAGNVAPEVSSVVEHGTANAARPEKSPDGLFSVEEINVLIVDDDPGVSRVMQLALANKNFVIDAITDMPFVEAQLRSKNYHVIVLDYVLPGLDFDRVQTWLQELQPHAGIIVVTGFPTVDSALTCLRARIFDYLTKPFQMADLKKVVRRCLESKGLLRMSEEALREALGAAIRERRKAQNLTLAQMAQRANVSLGYLSQIELGKNSASIETLYRISLGLGIRIAELFQSVQLNC